MKSYEILRRQDDDSGWNMLMLLALDAQAGIVNGYDTIR